MRGGVFDTIVVVVLLVVLVVGFRCFAGNTKKPDYDFLKEHFLREGKLSTDHVYALVRAVKEIFKSEENVLHLDDPITGACVVLWLPIVHGTCDERHSRRSWMMMACVRCLCLSGCSVWGCAWTVLRPGEALRGWWIACLHKIPFPGRLRGSRVLFLRSGFHAFRNQG